MHQPVAGRAVAAMPEGIHGLREQLKAVLAEALERKP